MARDESFDFRGGLIDKPRIFRLQSTVSNCRSKMRQIKLSVLLGHKKVHGTLPETKKSSDNKLVMPSENL
jgi:hypothetical protein